MVNKEIMEILFIVSLLFAIVLLNLQTKTVSLHYLLVQSAWSQRGHASVTSWHFQYGWFIVKEQMTGRDKRTKIQLKKPAKKEGYLYNS
jgi:hypothetical protein